MRGRPRGHSQFLHHQPRRSRQVDALGPDPRTDQGRRPPGHESPVPRFDGPRARARHHDQGPERAGALARPCAPADRHPGPRRLRLRGLEEPRGLRGGGAPRRRVAGHRGPDARELLPRPRARPRDRRRAQQDRPPRRRPGPVRGRDRARPRASGRADPADLRQDGSRRRRPPRRGRAPDPGSEGRSGRPAPGTVVRLVLRPVPGRRQRRPRGRRDPSLGGQAAVLAGRGGPRRRGGGHPHAGTGRDRRPRPG